jgi:hypothetical protein
VVQRFVYLKRGTLSDYLSAAAGQEIPDRSLVLSDLDVFQRQNAWSAVSVKRNEELVPGKPSADVFVYRTADVQFANPYPVSLTSDREIDIATIGTGSAGGVPVTQPLLAHLSTLFDHLLKANQEPELTIYAQVSYACQLMDAVPLDEAPIAIPILMQAPLTIDVSPGPKQGGAGGGIALADMIDHWNDALFTWFGAHMPAGGGELRLDLGFMSNLTETPHPLIRLTRLCLPLANITNPALPVYKGSAVSA